VHALEDQLAEALIAVRALHLAATVMLVGAVIFQSWVMAPLLRGSREAAGAHAAANLTNQIAWISFAVAVFAGAAWLAVLTAQINSDANWDALVDDVPTLLTQTQFGRVAELRFVIGILLMCALGWRRSRDGLRWFVFALALCFAGSLAWAGHSGAGDGFTGGVQAVVDALHLIAASAWVGGLVPLACLFVQASRPSNSLSPAQVGDITQRFSIMGIICVTALLITGLINTWFLVESLAILVGSSYGQLLMIKVALFLVMVGIAAINRTRLTPMITVGVIDMRSKVTRHLARNSLIEAGVGLAILAIVGALGSLPPELTDEHHMHSPAH
jgi:copper resistance protein D